MFLKKDDSVGYRALVQTEDHLLLFLQQLGEQTSFNPFFFRPVYEFRSGYIFWAVDRLLETFKYTLSVFSRAVCHWVLSNFLAF